MPHDPQVRSLARRVLELERKALKQKQPSLGHSTVEGGALQVSRGSDGVLTMIVGRQFDGTNTASVVVGPTPPKPVVPLVTPSPSALVVYWDGTYDTALAAPMDFTRVTVHAEPSATFTTPNPLDQTHIVGEFTSATGGEIVAALPYEEHIVYLVSWSQAGNHSVASDVATGTPSVIDVGDISEEIEAALAAGHQALADAATAQAAADNAAAVGAAAQADADQAVLDAAAAQAAANAAQTTANGMSRINYGTSAPTASTPGTPGDIFWVRSGNQIVGQYLCTAGTDTGSGNTWVEQALTNATIATLDAAKITTGTLDADRIAADSITSAKIAANTITAADIAANTITAAQIAANTITAAQIAANTISAAQIAANTITAAQIAADTITATQIAAGAVTASEIAANAVTAEKILANAIAANHISVGAVTSAAIDADAINGKTITGALFRSAASGRRVELSTAGFRQYASDGETVIISIGDTNKFTGDMDATSIQIQDQLALRGTNNVFAKGSKVVMQSGQSAPNVPPTLSVFYQETTGPGLFGFSTNGAHLDPSEGSPSFGSSLFGVGSLSATGAKKYTWPNTVIDPNGDARSEWVVDEYTRIYTTAARAVTISSHWQPGEHYPEGIYLKCYDDSVMNSSGTVAPTEVASMRVNGFDWNADYALGRCFAASPATTYRSHFSYAFASKNSSGTAWSMFVSALTPSGTTFSTFKSLNIPSFPRASEDEELVGVTSGSSTRMAFHGAEQWVWVIHTSKWNYVYSETGTRLTDLEFPPAITNAHTVFTIGDLFLNSFSGFRTMPLMTQNFRMTRYSDITWSGDGTSSDPAAVWWSGYRWRNKTTEATMRQTPVSPIVNVLMKKRAFLSVNSSSIPAPAAGVGATRSTSDDIWTFRYYLGKGTSQPADAAMWLQTFQPTDMATSVTLTASPVTSGTSLSTAYTSFVGSTPAEISGSDLSHDGLPKLRMTGDGSVRIETLDLRRLEPRVSGYMSADAVIGSGSFYTLGGWVADTLVDSGRPGHLTFTYSVGEFTIPQDGYYRVDCYVPFQGGGGSARILSIFIDGVERHRSTISPVALTGTSVFFEGNLTNGQKVSFRAYQDSGSNMTIPWSYDGTTKLSHFAIRRMSDRY